MSDKMMLAVGQALEVAPKHAPARVISARFKAGNGELDEAWKIVQDVLVTDPKYAPAWHLQGLISRYGKSDVPAAMASQRKASPAVAENEPATNARKLATARPSERV